MWGLFGLCVHQTSLGLIKYIHIEYVYSPVSISATSTFASQAQTSAQSILLRPNSVSLMTDYQLHSRNPINKQGLIAQLCAYLTLHLIRIQ